MAGSCPSADTTPKERLLQLVAHAERAGCPGAAPALEHRRGSNVTAGSWAGTPIRARLPAVIPVVADASSAVSGDGGGWGLIARMW